jgi:hypothetical protein
MTCAVAERYCRHPSRLRDQRVEPPHAVALNSRGSDFNRRNGGPISTGLDTALLAEAIARIPRDPLALSLSGGGGPATPGAGLRVPQPESDSRIRAGSSIPVGVSELGQLPLKRCGRPTEDIGKGRVRGRQHTPAGVADQTDGKGSPLVPIVSRGAEKLTAARSKRRERGHHEIELLRR